MSSLADKDIFSKPTKFVQRRGFDIDFEGLDFSAANLGLLLLDFDDEKTHSPSDKNPTF